MHAPLAILGQLVLGLGTYGGTKVLTQVARTVAILQRLERGDRSSEKGASGAETSAAPGK